MATPVSKRIQQDRKSTFLDNISARADEDQQKKIEKKSKEKEKSNEGGRTKKGKLGKTSGGGGGAKKVKLISYFILYGGCLCCLCTFIHVADQQSNGYHF